MSDLTTLDARLKAIEEQQRIIISLLSKPRSVSELPPMQHDGPQDLAAQARAAVAAMKEKREKKGQSLHHPC